MTKFADLHVHTNYSDSTASAEEVVNEALDKGLSCIAITDHDTVDGINPSIELAKDHDLEIVPGIELSTESHNKDIHILGYFFDYENSKLVDQLSLFQDARMDRIKRMIKKLTDQGVDNIKNEEVTSLVMSDAVGRPHLATLLIEKGWAKNIKQVFDKYLGENCPAYVPKYKQTPFEAIKLIKESGGVAVLAHPMVTNRDELIPSLVEAGLAGIEVYYPNCASNAIKYYEGIAKKHGLIMTGGSDAHGNVKKNTFLGKTIVSYQVVEELKARCA